MVFDGVRWFLFDGCVDGFVDGRSMVFVRVDLSDVRRECIEGVSVRWSVCLDSLWAFEALKCFIASNMIGFGKRAKKVRPPGIEPGTI